MSFTTLINNRVLKAINVICLIGLSILIWKAFQRNQYFVAEPDECIYYNSARLFCETGSVSAPVAVNGQTSVIGQCDWYGPMYHLLYGGVAKLFGFSIYNFLIVNILCFIGILALVYTTAFDTETKLYITAAFMSSYVFIAYMFQLYPEPVNLLFDTSLVLLLKKIYDNQLKDIPNRKAIILYALLVLLFSTFRVSTVFWMFGLLAFSRSKNQLYGIVGLCLVTIGLVLVYMHYFNAPYEGIFTDLFNGPFTFSKILVVVKSGASNIYLFFTHSNSFYDGLYLLLIVFSLFNYWVTRNRFVLSACIISLLSLFILLILYTSESSFLNKQTAFFTLCCWCQSFMLAYLISES